jgi:nucleoside-diphosphate-sugar epimerase
VGYGDIGRRVASHYTQQGQHITAICRTAAADSNTTTLKVDLDEDQQPVRDWLAANPSSQVYWFAPPQKHGITDKRIKQFCQALSNSKIKRFVYISTTAVYGDCQGRWIDEEEPLKPGTDRGKRRQNAEQCLQIAAKEHDFELVILRVPGIYGPGRWPLARLNKGLPVLKETESPYTNRIHQDDLANICIAAMHKAPVKTGEWRAYNCSDGQPSTMTDYFNRIADAFDIPQPPQLPRAEAEQQLTPGMLSFMNESKRLVSERLKEELQVSLRHPELKSALP